MIRLVGLWRSKPYLFYFKWMHLRENIGFLFVVCLIGLTSPSEQDWIILILKRTKLLSTEFFPVTGHKQFDWVKWDYSIYKSSSFPAWEFGSIVLEDFK